MTKRDDLLGGSERQANARNLFNMDPVVPLAFPRNMQSLPAIFGVSSIEMFAFWLFLLFSSSHVQYAVHAFPANTLLLPPSSGTFNISGYRRDPIAPNITSALYVMYRPSSHSSERLSDIITY